MNTMTLKLVLGFLGLVIVWFNADAAGRCHGGRTACSVERPIAPPGDVAPGLSAIVAASPQDFDRVPHIAPIDTSPEGQTYGRWAAAWAQWAFEIPAATNPILDTNGANCAQRQVDKVWFLAGSFGPAPVSRACTIPAGTSLFFPLINNNYLAFLNDPPETRTEAYVRAAASCNIPAQISVSIDGYKVAAPERFFTGPSGSQSPVFNVQLPPGNILTDDVTVIPELVLSPSAEQGYYLFVRPLRPGTHTIRWKASGCTSFQAPQDITYQITVGA